MEDDFADKSVQVNLVVDKDTNEIIEVNPENLDESQALRSQFQQLDEGMQKIQVVKPQFFEDHPEIDQISCPTKEQINI